MTLTQIIAIVIFLVTMAAIMTEKLHRTVAAVAGIDDRYLTELGGGVGSTLLGMAHGDDVGVAADSVDGVAHGLALGLSLIHI